MQILFYSRLLLHKDMLHWIQFSSNEIFFRKLRPQIEILYFLSQENEKTAQIRSILIISFAFF